MTTIIRKTLASLRVRLILLTLVMLVPALGLLVYVANQDRDDALVEVKSKALYLARLAAAEEAQIIQSTRQLLEQLAQTPEARSETMRAACDEMMARQIKPYPYYDNLGVIAPSGIRFCSVLLPQQSPDLSSRTYFRRAVESRDFSVGDYQIGGSSGKASVGFGYPVLDASGALRGVSYATLNLNWLGKSLARTQLPPQASLTVIDSQGIMLARFPDSEGQLGKPIAQAGIKEMQAQGSSGAYEGIGVDGIRRVWGFVALHQSASGVTIVRVGLPVVNAYAEINRIFYRTLMLIAALGLLILGAAWAGGERFVLQPVKRLTAAARHLGEGEHSARTGLPHGDGEFGELARAFDGMATSIESEETALQRLMAEQKESMAQLVTGMGEMERLNHALYQSETKFRTLYDTNSDAVMLLDETKFLDCNLTTLAMFGCATREEFYSKHPVDLSPPVQPDGTDSLALASQHIATAMKNGSIRFEWMHQRANTGETFAADVLLTTMTLDDKLVLQAVVRDITERKRADADLLRFATELDQRIFAAASANDALQRETAEMRRLNEERAVLGNMNELLLACASADEAFDIFGRAAAGLFESSIGALHIYAASRNQLTPAATWGDWPDIMMPFSPESCWGLRRGNYYLGNGTSTPTCEHAGPVPGGATLCVPLMAYGEVLGVLHLRGADASTLQSKLQLVTMANDGLALTLANIRLRQSLKEQSIRDPLTGLFNRRYLTETIERELARAQRSGMPVAVIMLDVDHFKRFNDTFGHDAGDAVLRELGSFLKRSIRADDIACRYGGEEFCLVLPQMDHFSAQQRAEAIRVGAAALEVKSDGRVLGPVTLSLGVALYPEDGGNMDSLVRAADVALYEAKNMGRNRVVMTSAGPFLKHSETSDQKEQPI